MVKLRFPVAEILPVNLLPRDPVPPVVPHPAAPFPGPLPPPPPDISAYTPVILPPLGTTDEGLNDPLPLKLL
jgi:hypothetical protein